MRDGVEHEAHRVDGRLVGALLLAAADPARGRHRARLRDADELERDVAVGGLALLTRLDPIELFWIGCVTNHATTIWKTSSDDATTRPPMSAPRGLRALVAIDEADQDAEDAIAQATAPPPSASATIATSTSDGPTPPANFSQKS